MQVNDVVPKLWRLTCVQSTLLSFPDPLVRISHQLLLPAGDHNVCLCYKNYSTLFHFSHMSRLQNVLCLRPCHSFCVLHEPSAISEAQQALTWCVLNSFNGCLLNSCRSYLTPACKLPQAIVLILSSFTPPLDKLMKAMHLYNRKMQQPVKFYILLVGSWILDSESNWFEFNYRWIELFLLFPFFKL